MSTASPPLQESAATDASSGSGSSSDATADPAVDPRLDSEYVRTVPTAGDAGTVTLIGVVHDHPASIARVRSVVERTAHATLALELPPLAIPLFEEYADDPRTPPAFGGEMSAAIQASDARIVGIDGPSRPFLRTLARRVIDDQPEREVLSRLLSSTARAARHAACCRLAAVLSRRLPIRAEVGSPRMYDCTVADPPSVQAEDERAQISQAKSVLEVFAPPDLARRDAIREDCMARVIAADRGNGPVVAVVGIDHLDGLESRLDGR